jgi:hypothetical protein
MMTAPISGQYDSPKMPIDLMAPMFAGTRLLADSSGFCDTPKQPKKARFMTRL